MNSTESKYLDTRGPWYNVKLPMKQCSLKELATFSIPREKLDELYQEAQNLLDDETAKFHGGYDRKNWYAQQFQKRGTVTDRIASSAVQLSGPEFMYHFEAFPFLFDTARNDSHNFEQALKAIAAVWPKLLPARPLKKFAAQYFATLPNEDDGDARKKVLLYWYIEDFLKRTYGQFLTLMEGCLKDKLTARREAWLNVAGKLLISIAEVRHVTIAMVVDKLGDPMAKISHKAYHMLLGMLSETSTSQAMLLNEIEKVLFQKNCPLPTQKYCVNVINQLVFNRDERKLALKCVQTFLALFKKLAYEGHVDHTITDAIIIGLRRAFPFTGSDFSVLDSHVDALFVIANTGSNFSQRTSAMMLLYQLVSKGYTKLEDRYYRAMYHLLLISPKQLPHSSQLTGFFASLYKTVRNDKNPNRVAAFVHRLLQRCMFANEAFICASLLLVAEAVNCHTTVRNLIRGKKATAETKKSLVGGAQVKSATAADDEDEEERFVDADRVKKTTAQQQKKKPAAEKPAAAPDAATRYNPQGRDPQYSHAASECFWVLNSLARHSHPSVVKLAVLIREGCDVSFDTHPLDDLTITNFLEMFVDASGGGEGTGPSDAHGNKLVSADTKGVAVFRRAVHVPHIPRFSDPNFAKQNPQDVDVSALFLHRFAVQRERFVEERGKKPSAIWGTAEDDEEEKAEEDGDAVEGRVSNINNAFMGAELKSEKKKEKKKDTKKDEKKPKNNKSREEGFFDGDDSEEEVDAEQFDFDFQGEGGDDDDDFDWGDGSDGYGDSEDEEAFTRATARITGKPTRKIPGEKRARDDDDDDSDDDTGALGGKTSSGRRMADADEFANIMAVHKERPNKKQRKEESWLERAADGPARGRGRGGSRGGFRGRH